MYNNLKIRSKMLLGFVSLTVIMLAVIISSVIGLMGVIGSHENLASGHFLRRDTRYDYRHAFEAMQRHTNAMIMYASVGRTANVENSYNQARYAYLDALASLEAYNVLVLADEDIPQHEKDLRLATSSEVAGVLGEYYGGIIGVVLQYARLGDSAGGIGAIAAGDTIAQRLFEVNDRLNAISDVWMEGIEADNQALETMVYTIMIIGIIFAIIAAVFFTIVTTRSIANPINKLSAYALKMSKGDFSSSLRGNYTDEVGQLMNLMSDMVEPLNSLIDDLEGIKTKAEQGGLSMRVDSDNYIGSYRNTAENINGVLDIVVDNAKDALGVFNEYAHGNFNSTLKPLEGESKIFNQAANEMQKELKTVYDSILKVVNSGDLRSRLSTEEHQGDWASLLENLNKLLDSFTTPIDEIKEVMTRLGKEGKLDKRVEGDYAGEFLDVKLVINGTMENLTGIVQDVSQTLSAVASGDLTTYISQEYPGDFSAIRDSLNNISSTLNKTMSEISSASEQVLTGAKQISNSATDLANGASQQAASVQDLNDSIELINGQTKQNAENAQNAHMLSNRSMENANEGNSAMQKMLEAMMGIKDSSANISKIIKVIQDIAFQTNILALNAAVEAARAGDMGKGFSVVAEEVRSLAARSQKAAAETTGLIEDSINRVDTGGSIAETTAESLNAIVANADEVLGVINEISDSSKEQAEAVSQVSVGVGQISSVVQSNSAVSQETAAAAEELNSQAELLRQLVSYFKV